MGLSAATSVVTTLPSWPAARNSRRPALAPSGYAAAARRDVFRSGKVSVTIPRQAWTYGSLLIWSREQLKQSGLHDTRIKAEFLLAHVLGTSRLDLFLESDVAISKRVLSPGRLRELEKGLSQLLDHVPIEYITGRQAFYGRTFRTGKGAFITRPESEKLVDLGLKLLRRLDRQIMGTLHVAEPFAGSACVSLSLAQTFGRGSLAPGRGDITFHCSELYETPARLARDNIRDRDGRVKIYIANLFAHRGAAYQEMYHLILGNPPYVETAAAQKLGIKEPLSAIDGGRDGLVKISNFLRKAPRFLHPQGYFVMEIHAKLESAVLGLCRKIPAWKSYKVLRTTGGSRLLVATKFENADFTDLERSEAALPTAMTDAQNTKTLGNKIMRLLVDELSLRHQELGEVRDLITPGGRLRLERPHDGRRLDADLTTLEALAAAAERQLALAGGGKWPSYFEVLRIHIQAMKHLVQPHLAPRRFFTAWHLEEKDSQWMSVDNYTVVMLLLESMSRRLTSLRELRGRCQKRLEPHLSPVVDHNIAQAEYLLDVVISFCRGEVNPTINERLTYGLRSNWQMVKGGLALQCERLDECIAVTEALYRAEFDEPTN